MRLTPIEIRQHRFAYRLRGLDAHEVQAFLETVIADFEEIVRENAELRRELERLHADLEAYQGREQTIQQTLTTAQGVVEQLKRTAMKEAEVLIGEAEVRAERILKEAEARRSQLQGEISDLRLMRERCQFDLRKTLEGYLRAIQPIGATDGVDSGPIEEVDVDPRSLPRTARKRSEG
jgi:cell division initiation protein